MIEETILKYMSDNLAYPVYMERPETPDEKYYLIERVGGSRSNHLYTSIFAIQSVARSLFDAASMNEELLMVVYNDAGGICRCSEISKAVLNGNSNDTDPETGEYKYQAVFEIYHY